MIAIGPLVFARPDVFRVEQFRSLLAMRYCSAPGCHVIVARGRCPLHRARPHLHVRRWYYLARWRRLRDEVRVDQAYACARCGQVDSRLEVDHIRKHDGDAGLFWDRANLQGLCAACHALKTRSGA